MDLCNLNRTARITALLSILVAIAATVVTSGCRPNSESDKDPTAETIQGEVTEPQRFSSTGIVKSITPSRSFVVLDHKDIVGFMDAMTMPFPVASSQVIDGVEVGNTIEFSLIVDNAGARITEAAVIEPDESAPKKEVLPNDAALDFSLPKLGGGTFSLADHRGDIVLVNFWATWCAPCREEIPTFIDSVNEHAEHGYTIVGVSVDKETVDEVPEFVEEFQINYPIVIDNGSLADLYGGDHAIPTTFVIDRDGQVRHRLVGRISKSTLQGILADML